MPESHDRDIAQAGALFRRGETDAAYAVFEGILGSDPSNVVALHGLGLCLHARGERDCALCSFRQAVSLAPSAWNSWQSIADLTPDETERRYAIDQTADILLSLCQAGVPSSRWIQHTVRALVCAGRSQQALRLLHDRFCSFDDPAPAHVLIAGTHYSLGAHCWVEYEGAVLNDHLEHVAAFTPSVC